MEFATLFHRPPLVPSMVLLDHQHLCLTTVSDQQGLLADLEAQDMVVVAQDMVLHMAKVHLQLLVMAHLRLLAMVNPKLLVMVNSKLLSMAHLKLLPMVNSNLQHNSLQPLSDSTGIPDELCPRNVLC